MNYSAQARDAALTLEVKKDGLQQRQSGEWVLRLTVHPSDFPTAVMQAPMGTRYQCVLVELDDNDIPKQQREEDGKQQLATAPGLATIPVPADRARKFVTNDKPSKSWHELSPAQQAGILCSEPTFWKFLTESFRHIDNSDDAAECVRGICGVKSRADIKLYTEADHRWSALVSDYRAWNRAAEFTNDANTARP